MTGPIAGTKEVRTKGLERIGGIAYIESERPMSVMGGEA
jgi:hypothetical protein